ncbi:MAG: hypothetical protein JWQ19_2846 [Subtercola sp.]|nr:hypothetical protein [Subtercola sp.]
MTITHVQLFSVPVSDQDRARDFYVGTLGFDLINDVQMGPDMRWLQVSPPGAQTAITLVTWFESMPAGSTRGIVLETDDLIGEVERLSALGVVTSPIERQPWGTFVTLDDPDGNGIVLQETAMP